MLKIRRDAVLYGNCTNSIDLECAGSIEVSPVKSCQNSRVLSKYFQTKLHYKAVKREADSVSLKNQISSRRTAETDIIFKHEHKVRQIKLPEKAAWGTLSANFEDRSLSGHSSRFSHTLSKDFNPLASPQDTQNAGNTGSNVSTRGRVTSLRFGAFGPAQAPKKKRQYKHKAFTDRNRRPTQRHTKESASKRCAGLIVDVNHWIQAGVEKSY